MIEESWFYYFITIFIIREILKLNILMLNFKVIRLNYNQFELLI